MKRLGLFGAGRIGRLHAANIAAHRGCRLAKVCDPYAPAAREVAAASGAVEAGAAEIFDDPDIDGVVIASATDTHIDLIERALAAGKPVLCEKPIDLDAAKVAAGAERLGAARGRVLMGFNRRFDPSHGELQRAVAAGEIGTPELLVITSRDPHLAAWANLEASGGLFRDMTIHDFDLARFILGEEFVQVYATGAVHIEPKLASLGDIDTAMVVMRSVSGVLVHINNSRRAVYGYDQRLEAFGARGMVRSDNRLRHSVSRHGAAGTDIKPPLPAFFTERYPEAYVAELTHFVEDVIPGGPPLVGFDDGLYALQLADAAMASLGSGRAEAPG